MSRRPPLTPRQKAVAAGFGVLLAAAAAGMVWLTARSPAVQQRLARDAFEVGRAESLARRVAADGGQPLLFRDPLGGRRDLLVHHLGGERWVAVEARAPGAAAGCVLRFDTDSRRFRDPCSGRTFPETGEGLHGYPTRVTGEGALLVDLRARE